MSGAQVFFGDTSYTQAATIGDVGGLAPDIIGVYQCAVDSGFRRAFYFRSPRVSISPSSAFHNNGMPEPGDVPELYCPNCARPVNDPLVCGDCSAVICRVCGTPLERADELGLG
ncbi:MAG: hypothetical protein WBY44_33685 [Bryobacteraceae bacterium]